MDIRDQLKESLMLFFNLEISYFDIQIFLVPIAWDTVITGFLFPISFSTWIFSKLV